MDSTSFLLVSAILSVTILSQSYPQKNNKEDGKHISTQKQNTQTLQI
jgi:hypothetical protein